VKFEVHFQRLVGNPFQVAQIEFSRFVTTHCSLSSSQELRTVEALAHFDDQLLSLIVALKCDEGMEMKSQYCCKKRVAQTLVCDSISQIKVCHWLNRTD